MSEAKCHSTPVGKNGVSVHELRSVVPCRSRSFKEVAHRSAPGPGRPRNRHPDSTRVAGGEFSELRDEDTDGCLSRRLSVSSRSAPHEPCVNGIAGHNCSGYADRNHGDPEWNGHLKSPFAADSHHLARGLLLHGSTGPAVSIDAVSSLARLASRCQGSGKGLRSQVSPVGRVGFVNGW